MKKSLQQRIEEAVQEEISIVPYNPSWPDIFETEVLFLRKILPASLIIRIVHFGSTAIPGMSAKPIVDMLVEVSSLKETKKQIVPLLVSEGYDYFWRADSGPAYAWFIKRNSDNIRTHHLHMVEVDSRLWDRLYFRDYLKTFPEEGKQYETLKRALAAKHPHDRAAYTKGKTSFVVPLTEKARQYFKKQIDHRKWKNEYK